MTQQQRVISPKSVGTSYILFFFLGRFAAHQLAEAGSGRGH